MALRRGQVSEEQLMLLIQLTKIRSAVLIKALRMHLVEGKSQRLATETVGINQSFLSVRLRKLRDVEATVLKLRKFY
ncbi:adhesin biosynthesis transcription regulatory family protein [Vibrio harveyi]|uniref:PapB/FocB family fimbrial expression transcriptional regulator n=1 Tax=Vibrio TaxID=662 RepID=UPI0022CD842B|nr:PapB/FocB family fimbrial expression transcriptional regulator [Vibrio sp. NFR]MDA0133005.1 PapB/FocB family fimbrial expression transcriptional regulator [Vibrio sp. NFR]